MTVYGEITYVFYMPQDYAELKQFEAENDLSIYKRVEDTIAVRYNYKTNATYPYESKADRKTENSSEKPNNCEECKHWNDTKDGCADRHGCRTTTEDCSTVPTSSILEQVDKDINVRKDNVSDSNNTVTEEIATSFRESFEQKNSEVEKGQQYIDPLTGRIRFKIGR